MASDEDVIRHAKALGSLCAEAMATPPALLRLHEEFEAAARGSDPRCDLCDQPISAVERALGWPAERNGRRICLWCHGGAACSKCGGMLRVDELGTVCDGCGATLCRECKNDDH